MKRRERRRKERIKEEVGGEKSEVGREKINGSGDRHPYKKSDMRKTAQKSRAKDEKDR